MANSGISVCVLRAVPRLLLAAVFSCWLQLKVLCEGVVETVGRLRVGDWSTPFTAHPKLDTTTGVRVGLQPGTWLCCSILT